MTTTSAILYIQKGIPLNLVHALETPFYPPGQRMKPSIHPEDPQADSLEEKRQARRKKCVRRVKYSNIRGDGKWSASIGAIEGAHLAIGRERANDYVFKQWRALRGLKIPGYGLYDCKCLSLEGHDAIHLPTKPIDRRRKKFVRVIEVPKSLCHAQSDEELAKACMEALIGWLNLYQSGILHRNIGLPNVLLGEKKDERKPFKFKKPESLGQIFDTHMHNVIKKRVPHVSYYLQAFRVDEKITIERWANKIEGLMEKANISGGLTAFVQEDPYNVEIEDLITNSPEYMKRASGKGMDKYMSGHQERQNERRKRGKEYYYIQNPIDDFKSFMWTFCMALILREDESRTLTRTELGWRKKALDMDTDERWYLRRMIYNNMSDRKAGDPFRVGELFRDWKTATNSVRMDCRSLEEDLSLSRRERLYLWHIWAYKGVADILQVYVDHLAKIKG